MLMMSETPYSKFELPTPEAFKEASEKVTNFWIGACSPMWMPFFAATSFGIGSWMMSTALSRSVGESAKAYKDLPAGFIDMMSMRHNWLHASEAASQMLEGVTETVKEVATAQVKLVIEAEEAVIEALDSSAPAVQAVAETVEAVTEDTADHVNEATEAVVETVSEAASMASTPIVPDEMPEEMVEPAFTPMPSTAHVMPKRRPNPRK